MIQLSLEVSFKMTVNKVILLLNILLLFYIGAIQGFFSQILTGEEPVRERCLKFLSTNIKKLGPEVFNKEAEDILISECKKVLQVRNK